MKIALITDQHFGVRNDSVHFLDFYEKFYKETFFPTLEKEKIDTVLVLGDTFDRRKFVNFNSLKRTKEMFFDVLKEKNIKVHMLAGNHDTFHKNTNEVNSISLLLSDYDNLDIIDKPKHINLGGTEICMIPWICADNYDECQNIIKESKAEICCGHFEIAGFAMHRGQHSEEGLNREMFRKFGYTFSGHYHHKSTSNGIYYLGNPYETTWMDYDDPRGFHIFDLSTQNLKFIRNPNRIFFKIVYDDVAEKVTDIIKKDLTKYAGTYVKVVVLNKKEPYTFDKFMENLYNVNPVDIQVVEDYAEIDDKSVDDTVNQAEDTITIITKVIDSIDDEGLQKNKLKSIMRQLYLEALNGEA